MMPDSRGDIVVGKAGPCNASIPYEPQFKSRLLRFRRSSLLTRLGMHQIVHVLGALKLLTSARPSPGLCRHLGNEHLPLPLSNTSLKKKVKERGDGEPRLPARLDRPWPRKWPQGQDAWVLPRNPNEFFPQGFLVTSSPHRAAAVLQPPRIYS